MMDADTIARASRRGFGKLLLAATSMGVAGEAKAQFVSGTDVYVPYNCYTQSVLETLPYPRITYVCKPVSDISLLTLMLNFEYLEASFFLYAVTGAGLPVGDLGGQAGTVTGGAQATFTNPVVAAYANELATDERRHVEFLRQTIISAGLVPASMPFINFTTGFTSYMRLAGLIGASDTFNAFANDTNFLLAAYLLQDIVVTAYRGILTQLTSSVYLDKLAGLTATEGYHSGIVRTLLFQNGEGDATNAISFARDVIDGSEGTPTQGNDHGVGTTSAATITNGDGNSIIEARTALQAIKMVFNLALAASPEIGEMPFFFTSGFSNPT